MNIWLSLLSVLMALGWLLPNHQLPWITFHSEAWVAAVLLGISLASFVYIKARQSWTDLLLLVAAIIFVPLIQLSLGQIQLTGVAWTSFLYLLGFFLTLLTGSQWESEKPGVLADALFLAFGFAATMSLGLQLCQWLSVSDGCICSSELVLAPADNHASANLGQTNHLALLFIWGILGYGWAWLRKAVRGLLAVVGIGLLLFGLALTQSFIGVLLFVVLVVCIWRWRYLWPQRGACSAGVFLLLLFGVLTMLLNPLSLTLWFEYPLVDIWTMFLNAVLQQPWFGYGWNQTVLAQVAPATSLPAWQVIAGQRYMHADNLFLDLIVWVGIPLGLTISSAALYWLVHVMRAVKNGQDSLLLMFVFAAGVFAMVGSPLYYAYFLLPLGVIIGMLEVRLRMPTVVTTGRTITFGLWLVTSLLLVITMRDYFRAEESYTVLRMEQAKIGSRTNRLPPDVVLLTQLRDSIILARLEPSPSITKERMAWLKSVALSYPTSANLLKLAATLALNDQPAEATVWLARTCELSTTMQCNDSRHAWARLQKQLPRLAEIHWPAATAN